MRQRSSSENPGLLQSGLFHGIFSAAGMGQGRNQTQSQYEKLRNELLEVLRKKIIEAYPSWTQSIKTWLDDTPNPDAGQIIEQLSLLQLSSAKAGSGWSGDSDAKALADFILRIQRDQYTPLRFLRTLEADRAQQVLHAQQQEQAQQTAQAMMEAQRLPGIPELEAPVPAARPGKTPEELAEEIMNLKISQATLKAQLEGKAEQILLLNRELEQAKSSAKNANETFRAEVGAFRLTMGDMNTTFSQQMGSMTTNLVKRVELLNDTINENARKLEATLNDQPSRNYSLAKDELPEPKKSVPVVVTKWVTMGKQFLAKDQLLTTLRIGAICAMGDLLHTFNAFPFSNEDKAIYGFASECVKLLASASTLEECFKQLTTEGTPQAALLAKTSPEFREFFNGFTQVKDDVPLTTSPEKLADLKNCLKGMFSAEGYNVPELKAHFPSKPNGKKSAIAQSEGSEKKSSQPTTLLGGVFKAPAVIQRATAPASQPVQPLDSLNTEAQTATTDLNL